MLREVFDSGRPLTYIRSAEEQRVVRVLRAVSLHSCSARHQIRARAAPHQPAAVQHVGMDLRASHSAHAGHAYYRHHDVRLRRDAGGFTAFISWTFQRENTSLGLRFGGNDGTYFLN
jgi:hypothetical protein